MSYLGMNLTAILAAAFISMGISALYHVVFNAEQLNATRGHRLRLVLATFVAELWLAAILAGALILAPVDANAWTIALVTPIVIWIGFVLPALVVSASARGLRILVIVLDCTHWLVVMVVQAAVLHSVGLVRPLRTVHQLTASRRTTPIADSSPLATKRRRWPNDPRSCSAYTCRPMSFGVPKKPSIY